MIPSSLQTALAAYDNNDPREDDERMVLAAARSLAEGETIWWCEVHQSAGTEKICDGAEIVRFFHEPESPCSIVEKILADPPKETE